MLAIVDCILLLFQLPFSLVQLYVMGAVDTIEQVPRVYARPSRALVTIRIT